MAGESKVQKVAKKGTAKVAEKVCPVPGCGGEFVAVRYAAGHGLGRMVRFCQKCHYIGEVR